jgi:hypothetical protein
VGEITGGVFYDADRDSVIDPGEGPLPGATVFLDENSNGVPDPGERPQTTGVDGRYTFEGLAPGRYFVNIFEPVGVAQTVPTAGGYNVTVEAGKRSEAPPFAMTRTSVVVGRYVFYNHSSYDGNDAAANADDDAAIAPDKAPLRPYGPLTNANVTNYTRGINGVMIDMTGLPEETTLTPDDFYVATRLNGGHYSPWDPAPPPSSVSVRRGAGAGGSDRITLVWPDDTFRNIWVRVLVRNDERTGLYHAHAVYFGNLVGETDAIVPAGSKALRVDAMDLAAVKRELNTSATITSRVDFNRDGRVNALDLGIARSNLNRTLPEVLWPGPSPESLTEAAGPPFSDDALRAGDVDLLE